jgi:hypothetical protein
MLEDDAQQLLERRRGPFGSRNTRPRLENLAAPSDMFAITPTQLRIARLAASASEVPFDHSAIGSRQAHRPKKNYALPIAPL